MGNKCCSTQGQTIEPPLFQPLPVNHFTTPTPTDNPEQNVVYQEETEISETAHLHLHEQVAVKHSAKPQAETKEFETIIEEQVEEENKNERIISSFKFNKQLENLSRAASNSKLLQRIASYGEKVTIALRDLEVIISILSERGYNSPSLRDFKNEVITLFGDMQLFRSFHLHYTLDQSFVSSDLDEISNAANILRAEYVRASHDGKLNLEEFTQQLLGHYNNNNNNENGIEGSDEPNPNNAMNASQSRTYVEFEAARQGIARIRAKYSTVPTAGLNFSTLPNYIYMTLREQPGFALWETLFPLEFETTNDTFAERYAKHCGTNKADVLQIIQLLDAAKDRRVDIYQWIDFVNQFGSILDHEAKLLPHAIAQFNEHIEAQTRAINQTPVQLENGSFRLASGAIYTGEFDQTHQKQGHGSIKDDDYSFEGTFVDDLAYGYGQEIRKLVEYTGNFERGLYHGEGTLTFPNGRTYKGNFQCHEFHGQGELIGDSGIRYSGEWKHNKLELGKITYHDGSTYVGQLYKNIFKQGKGTFSVVKHPFLIESKLSQRESSRLNNDANLLVVRYEGQWNKDAPLTGKAFSCSETIIYDGQFVNWAFSGKGKRIYIDGTYEGELRRDQKQNSGKILYLNGDFFEGKWKDDFQSEGVFYFGQDKTHMYVGTWVNGSMQGNGKFTYPNGGAYVGEVKDGKRHGHGEFTFNNGNTYIGTWVNNEQHGEGEFTYAPIEGIKGDVYRGQFDSGKFHGFGHYKYSKVGKQYIGFWANGKWEGEGKFFKDSNQIISAGVWKDDNMIAVKDANSITIPDELTHLILPSEHLAVSDVQPDFSQQ